MKHINQKAKKVLETLISKIENEGAKISNDDFYMPVYIDQIRENMYSLAHYYKQNGDLMADPQMVFLKGSDDNFYPCSFKNDGTGFYRDSVLFEHGEVKKYYPKTQMEDKNFANMWQKDIKDQQSL